MLVQESADIPRYSDPEYFWTSITSAQDKKGILMTTRGIQYDCVSSLKCRTCKIADMIILQIQSALD